MNWEALKEIYRFILIDKGNIEYLGGDEYKLTRYHKNGNKSWETTYQNGKLHGESIHWYESGHKLLKREYQNGQLHGKHIGWYDENENKHWKEEYKNGKLIK